MTRLDLGDWRQVHFDTYAKTDPYQEFIVSLNGAYERIRVQVFMSLPPANWIRAGYLYQFWGGRFTGTLVTRHFLPLQETVLCKLEPVQNSTLAFRLLPWISEVGIQIEADFSSINPG